MRDDTAAIRAAEFPWADRGDVLYLNHASTGPLPRRSVAAATRYAELRGEPARLSDEDQFAVLQQARETCAMLISARSTEIALMPNTSYGINLAARALRLQPGDAVVVPDREFPANMYPWLGLAREGVRVVAVPARDRLLDEEAYVRALDQPGVRAASVSWLSFETGHRADLARIGAACRERGITFVVDAIQGLGPATLDVRSYHIDFLACGGQKWLLAPWGTGFVYVRQELLAAYEPLDIGWLSVRGGSQFTDLVHYDATFLDDARRFEVGSLAVQDFAAMVASVGFLLEVGPDVVAKRTEALVASLIDWASANSAARLVTPADPGRRAGIVSLAPPDPHRAMNALTDHGVVASLREGLVRLSPYFYNTDEEMQRVIRVLESAL